MGTIHAPVVMTSWYQPHPKFPLQRNGIVVTVRTDIRGSHAFNLTLSFLWINIFSLFIEDNV